MVVYVCQLCLALCGPPDSSVCGFSQQEYWSGLPFPSPGHLPNPGIEPAPPALAGRLFTPEPPDSLVVRVVHGTVDELTVTYF